jgi:hypothetical protein
MKELGKRESLNFMFVYCFVCIGVDASALVNFDSVALDPSLSLFFHLKHWTAHCGLW